MKPFIIYTEKDSTDIIITKKEFEKYIKEAYDNGYDDGYKAGKAQPIQWDFSKTIKDYPVNIPVYYGTGTPVAPNPYQVTCEAHNSVE